MKGLKHLGLFWQLCVERYRHLAPHERQAISEAIGESLETDPSRQFPSPVKIVALVPAEHGLFGWKTPRAYRLPSTILQQGEQPLDALRRLLQSSGLVAPADTDPLPAGFPRLDHQGRLVIAFRVQQRAAVEDLAQAHLHQKHPEMLVAIPPGAPYECPVEADLVSPIAEAVLKENSLESVG